MGLMDRIATLVKADAHGVVDTVEDRSLLLRQHLREAELELHRKRARLEALETEEKNLEEERKGLEITLRGLEEDITIALEGDKEALARYAIKKRIPLKRRLAYIDHRLERGVSERESLAETLGEHETEFQELRCRVKTHLDQTAARERGDDLWSGYDPIVADEEVELELLRRSRASIKGGKDGKGGKGVKGEQP